MSGNCIYIKRKSNGLKQDEKIDVVYQLNVREPKFSLYIESN